MQLLIDITLPFVLDHGPIISSGSSSYLRLCDGPENLEIDGKTYFAGYLTSISDYGHKADILHGGNLEQVSEFAFEMVDDEISTVLEDADLSLSSGKIVIYYCTLDLETEMLWQGEIDSSEVKEGVLSINSTNLSKLGLIRNPKNYGWIFKSELEKDAQITDQNIRFTSVSNNVSEYPEIIKYGASDCPNDNFYGVQRQTSTSAYVVIKHKNQLKLFVPNSSIKFESAYSSTNANAMRYIVTCASQAISNYYETTLWLNEKFESNQIANIDRVVINNNRIYYKVPSTSAENINVSLKINDVFYQISSDSFSFEEIDGQRYLVIKPYYEFWKKVKIDSVTVDSTNSLIHPWTQAQDHFNPSAVLNEDVTDFYGFKLQTIYENKEIRFHLRSEELKTLTQEDLYLGYKLNLPSTLYDVKIYPTFKFKNGKHWPCDSAGNFSTFPDFQSTFFDSGVSIDPVYHYTQSTPIGYDTIPKHYVGAGTSAIIDWMDRGIAETGFNPNWRFKYYAYNNPMEYFQKFDKNSVFKIPDSINQKHYESIDEVIFTIFFDKNQIIGVAQEPCIVSKVGLFVKESINTSDVEKIYIDTSGTYSPYVDDFFRPAGFIKDIFVDANFETVDDFTSDLYVINNFYQTKVGDTVSDSIINIARTSNYVIGQEAQGKFYINPIVNSKLSATPIYSSAIYEIKEGLKDIDASEVVTFPKVIFKNKEGGEEYFEIISLSGSLPTGSEVSSNPDCLKKHFSFSTDFFEQAKYGPYNGPLDVFNTILKPIWNSCQQTFRKHGLSNKEEIQLDTFYINYIMSPKLQDQTVNTILAHSRRRKTLELTLGYEWRHTRLGKSVVVSDPRILAGASIYGFVDAVKVSLQDLKVTLSILCDSVVFINLNQVDIYDFGEEDVEDKIYDFGEESIADVIINN